MCFYIAINDINSSERHIILCIACQIKYTDKLLEVFQ